MMSWSIITTNQRDALRMDRHMLRFVLRRVGRPENVVSVHLESFPTNDSTSVVEESSWWSSV